MVVSSSRFRHGPAEAEARVAVVVVMVAAMAAAAAMVVVAMVVAAHRRRRRRRRSDCAALRCSPRPVSHRLLYKNSETRDKKTSSGSPCSRQKSKSSGQDGGETCATAATSLCADRET